MMIKFLLSATLVSILVSQAQAGCRTTEGFLGLWTTTECDGSAVSGGDCNGEETRVHANGGGKISVLATVSDEAYIDADSRVCGKSTVKEGSRIEMSTINSSNLDNATIIASTISSSQIIKGMLDHTTLSSSNFVSSLISNSTLSSSSSRESKIYKSTISSSHVEKSEVYNSTISSSKFSEKVIRDATASNNRFY